MPSFVDLEFILKGGVTMMILGDLKVVGVSVVQRIECKSMTEAKLQFAWEKNDIFFEPLLLYMYFQISLL